MTHIDDIQRFHVQNIPAHRMLWEKFTLMIEKQRITHAYLFLGDLQTAVRPFIHRFIAMQLCSHQNSPCGQCASCQRVMNQIHPDVHVIQPEDSGVIKIETIRGLSEIVYQTPQLASYVYVVIESAECMNLSAANALLKVLEEPPRHVRFLIQAKAQTQLPITIVSRCQRFSIPDVGQHVDYTTIEHQPAWREAFEALLNGTMTPWEVSEKWSKDGLPSILDWLYLVLVALFRSVQTGVSSSDWVRMMAKKRSAETWLLQIDRIHEIAKMRRKNISLNASLTLNHLLIGFWNAH